MRTFTPSSIHRFTLFGPGTQPAQGRTDLQISPRYVQRLLEKSGTSFTVHVTELRLKHAFMLLTAHCGKGFRISDIA